MTFISYAQNFEDVMLWRALKHVKNGFYIDIGAQDPVKDSVSLAFYENGWRGVHVEPTSQYSEKLKKARHDETVLQVAISAECGTLNFFEFPDTGLSPGDVFTAEAHRKAGFLAIETIVQTVTIDQLLDQFSSSEIHWLKLDVEGYEGQVLASWCISPVRPWVLVIESTKPLSKELTHYSWEDGILGKGYRFAYFDGLNRFYVSDRRLELLKSFETPPNIFDDFSLSGLASQPFYQMIELKALQAEARAQQAEARAQQAEATTSFFQNQLYATYASKSWRITAPLRWVSMQIRRLRDEGPNSRLKALRTKFFSNSGLQLSVCNKLRIMSHRLFSSLSIHRHFGFGSYSEGYPHLTPSAQRFYRNLKQAIQQRKKDGA